MLQDFSPKFFRINGFEYHVIGPFSFKTRTGFGGKSGDHDNGQVFETVVPADTTAYLMAPHIRHEKVQQHEVVRVFGHPVIGLLAVKGLFDLIAEMLQTASQDHDDIGFIVGYQDAFWQAVIPSAM